MFINMCVLFCLDTLALTHTRSLFILPMFSFSLPAHLSYCIVLSSLIIIINVTWCQKWDTQATRMATSYQIPAPEPFDCANSEEWPRWIRRFERFRTASGLTEKSEENQVNTLVYSMGDAADDIVSSFGLSEDELKRYTTVKTRFDQYFTKKKNTIYERARFNTRYQEDGEPVEAFITALHKLAAKCEYGAQMIRDRIVVGIKNHALSEKMQLEEGLDLARATKLARENEAIKKQQPGLRETADRRVKTEVDDIQTKGHKQKPERRRLPTQQRTGPPRSTTVQPQKHHKSCTRCGNNHPQGREHCPAKETKCHKCGKIGHFQRVCRSSINDITKQTETTQFLGAITQDNNEPWTIKIQVNRRPIVFKIDTGADVTVIPEELHIQERDGPLKPARIPLVGPSQHRLQVIGSFNADMIRAHKRCAETVYVVRGLQTPLVGRPAIQSLSLLTRILGINRDKESIITEYPELFCGLGKIKGSYHIELEEGAKPYSVSTPRRVPIPLLPKVQQELERMVNLGVISKVDEPTDWCSGMVVVAKTRRFSENMCRFDSTQLLCQT